MFDLGIRQNMSKQHFSEKYANYERFEEIYFAAFTVTAFALAQLPYMVPPVAFL